MNEVLESLLQQLQAHNNPHAGAVQAAINLAGAALQAGQGPQVHTLTPLAYVNNAVHFQIDFLLAMKASKISKVKTIAAIA